ncbi:unnamed protein product, partial [marine sediment metagenome]
MYEPRVIEAVVGYFRGKGYKVALEVGNIDVVAIKGNMKWVLEGMLRLLPIYLFLVH